MLWNKRNEKKVRIVFRKRKHCGRISGGSETDRNSRQTGKVSAVDFLGESRESYLKRDRFQLECHLISKFQ